MVVVIVVEEAPASTIAQSTCLAKTLNLESGCTHTHTPRKRGDLSFHVGQSLVWSSSSSSKRNGEQAREEDDSSADRRPEGGKRGERARREDNSSADRLRRRHSCPSNHLSSGPEERDVRQ